MIRLKEPSERYLDSYREAYREYQEHLGTPCFFGNPDQEELFLNFDYYRYERNLPPNRVGSSYFWLVDEEENKFIGEISIRHRLNEDLKRYGGHIGYVVRFSEWGKGYGTMMLRMALEEARKMGLSEVLITCDDNNTASARVMEHNGLILVDKIENTVDGKTVLTRRYRRKL